MSAAPITLAKLGLLLAALGLVACGQASRAPTRPTVHAPAPSTAPLSTTTPSTASPGAATAPTASPALGTARASDATISPESAQAVTVYALGLVGTPYRYGGNTPESGFDCSGLIAHVYRQQAGVATPRTVAGLKNWGQTVSPAELRSGDIAVFYQNNQATHAGIYVGDGRFVHAPSTGGRVRLDSVTSGYWARQTVRFQRPLA